ncbi:hypothetical protein DSO57_1020692 [Entomophthora muscae]|uniref:Uncharacterized protein n=1 Tax=Entomophthora muscae TaxID=34485 RepID=A0ACC2SSH0_9FUNG|nr:hypothetical protein DSO57_1020692 [Entomophthora muscae]
MKKAKRTKKAKRRKKIVEEKPLAANNNNTSPSPAPDPVVEGLPEEDTSLMNLHTIPKNYLPDEEEVSEDLLHQVLAMNTVTRRQIIRTEALPSQEAIDTVLIPYTEKLSQPSSELTHSSDRVKKSE